MSNEFRVISAPFKASMKEMERLTDRATVVGIRGVGRRLVQTEKRYAPVYAGPNGITRKSLTVAKLKPSRSGRAVIGLLKFSIRQQGRVRRDRFGGATIIVGPGGGRVNLYKNKIEREYRFVEKSFDEVVPQARVIMAEAWAKAVKKGI